MAFIDSHCHLDFSAFDSDRDAMIKKAEALGVNKYLVPSVSTKNFSEVKYLADAKPSQILPAYGLHPMFMNAHQPGDADVLLDWVKKHKSYAIGECGLDFYHGTEDKKAQIALFAQQVEIAKELRLPLIVHVRKAHNEIFEILKSCHFDQGGIIHAFSASLEIAKRYIKQGFCLGIGGLITYERANTLRRVIPELPLDSLVFETDSPDMATQSNKGNRNDPSYLPEIAKHLSELRTESYTKLVESVYTNTVRILRLKN